ncbi:beta-ketoacyl synthase N-terminal-like domain-containing protein, partial [Neisseria sp. P0021.S007]|uniref:beta-ketoacyl synthase N-terminal-like domain-containing protein n=1 Tax=Neisseria sp. P0021.S007 TaxID=3436822 RepID=UPI003F808A5C
LGRKEFADIAEQHLRQAAESAGWPSESWHDAPVFIGSSSYSISEYENRHFAGNRAVEEHNLLYLAEDLRRRSGNRQIFSFATACTSSAHALIQADNCLRGGAERAFVLGIENLNRLTLLHFHSLGLLAEHYQPFGGNGLILGEGVAALALSSAAPESSSGRLKLIGHAANTGNDLIQSDGQAQEQVMRRALDVAGIAPESIAAVKTHGIGTADSDAAELAALENIFGTLPPLMAFKPQIGHTLGATAALETA